MSTEGPLPCAECGTPLEPRSTRHGMVWVCRPCEGGAANVAVFRKVVPRGFVNHLWQAARHVGRTSKRRCPSCTQPFRAFDASEVEISLDLQVCLRCSLLWLERSALASLRLVPRRKGRPRGAPAYRIGGGP